MNVILLHINQRYVSATHLQGDYNKNTNRLHKKSHVIFGYNMWFKLKNIEVYKI
jgi:hypothetical protein